MSHDSGAVAVALTIWPEWAWAICHAGKRTENRVWFPPRHLIGKRFCIHAGKHVGGRPSEEAHADGLCGVAMMARRAGMPLTRGWDDGIVTSAIVAVVTLAGADKDERNGWDVPDVFHWRLADVIVLPEPVPHKGAQGLWPVSPSAWALVARQLEVADVA